MLKFKQLEITNYGPYYGSHKLTFSQKNGVTIVWGDNGFGKTSLLNCFRYVMWGTIMGREGTISSDICSHVNDKAVSEGNGMQISLDMEYDNKTYTLTRKYERKGGDGKLDKDYEEHIFLKCGFDILTDDQRIHFLNTTFPERISRFYLFDAELLSEYENLLIVDDANNKIKKSIEDILGLPVLERGANMLNAIQKGLVEDAVKNSKTEEKTKQDAILLESLSDKVDELNKSLLELQDKVDADEKKLGEIKEKQKQNESLQSINTQQDNIRTELKGKEDNLDETKLDINRSMESLWKTVISPVVSRQVEEARKRIKDLDTKNTIASVGQNTYEHIDDIFSTPLSCPDCGHIITKFVKDTVLENIQKLSSSPLTEEEISERSSLNAIVSRFTNFKEGDTKERISDLLKRKSEIQGSIDLLNVKLTELDKQRKSLKTTITDEELRGLIDDQVKLVAAIDIGKKSIEDAKNEIDEIEGQIDSLKLKIAQNSSKINKKVFKDAEFAKNLHSLFVDAMAEYSLKMKDAVEKDATDLFVRIAHNSNYKELEINENYGLRIVRKDGTYVPHRSTGYEQVVAISLIGALHKNTPISGPIVMDSTFQKIDLRHKSKVIDALPSLSDQVIVLAYDGELDRKYAKQSLGEKLINEKRINNDDVKSWIDNTDTK
jgi:DNA sulfur modification protein DndD